MVQNNGTVWFDIDGNLRVSRDQMSEFADGLHTLEELRDLHNERTQVVFKSAREPSRLVRFCASHDVAAGQLSTSELNPSFSELTC